MSPSAKTPEIHRLILPAAREKIQTTIADYGGAEVFFVCCVDANGLVMDADPCAYGNAEAVPVIEHAVRPGHVVIHNHPGGALEPSDADISIASRFGNLGVGSYIVDNEVTKVRIIVPVMPPREKKPLDTECLAQMLSGEGVLARSMPQYEHRPQQEHMLREVVHAFNNDGIAVIEAGTGTGKSLAYLLPAICWAKANGEPIVISTNTINLQEQLILKDIPFLQKHSGIEFQAVLMKGRGNYLCLRKSEHLKQTPDFFGDEAGMSQVESILAWAEKTSDGSLSDLGFIPDDEVWEQVGADADNCTRIKCPFYARCFFFESRRRAARADLIVANHHLVMADLAIRRETGNYTSTAVLPAYKRIIFDEAHNVEEVATNYFGITITRRTMTRLLARLVHRDRPNIGLLPYLHGALGFSAYSSPLPQLSPAITLIQEVLVPLRHQLWRSLHEMMDLCAEAVPLALHEKPRPKKEMQLRITPEVERSIFWRQSLRSAMDESVDIMEDLSQSLLRLHEMLAKIPEERRKDLDAPIGEVKAIASKIAERINAFRNFYTIGDGQCRWIEVYKSSEAYQASVRLISLPLEIQNALHEAVYETTPTIIMTSATLTVNRDFDFFLHQAGLNGEYGRKDLRERISSVQLDTPFDYNRQAFIGVPIDLPDPGSPKFSEAATNFLLPALQVSRGSAFLLFTSYQQLHVFYNRLAPVLRPMGYSCLKQGDESRHMLLKRFKNDRTSILFATSSFWEGVDVPGEALTLLVLVKLPFRVPTDPLLQARAERIDEMGGDSFSEYVVPQAVIKFKQGFGRLIRTKDDFGAVLILDRRVVTKSYGETFLNSLPVGTVYKEEGLELLEGLKQFFARSGRKP